MPKGFSALRHFLFALKFYLNAEELATPCEVNSRKRLLGKIASRLIPMRFLAGENVPRVAVDALRADGHDIGWVLTDSPGLDDRSVLARAVEEERVLLTFDTDFGEPAPSGVFVTPGQHQADDVVVFHEEDADLGCFACFHCLRCWAL